MRILITGSRSWTNIETIMRALTDQAGDLANDVTVVHGGARGADEIADHLARTIGWTVEQHRPDWRRGPRATHIRNDRMVAAGADVCLAFIQDQSSGSTSCARKARDAGIPTIVWRYKSGGSTAPWVDDRASLFPANPDQGELF